MSLQIKLQRIVQPLLILLIFFFSIFISYEPSAYIVVTIPLIIPFLGLLLLKKWAQRITVTFAILHIVASYLLFAAEMMGGRESSAFLYMALADGLIIVISLWLRKKKNQLPLTMPDKS